MTRSTSLLAHRSPLWEGERVEKGSRKAAAEGDWNPLGLERQSLSRSGGCQDPGGDKSGAEGTGDSKQEGHEEWG